MADRKGHAFPGKVCTGHAPGDENPIYEHPRGLTPQEYAAIHLRVPDSGTPWLDEMIRKAKRDEFAAQALNRLVNYLDSKNASLSVYRYADALLIESERKDG